MLLNSETGLIGVAWSAPREAWFSDEAKRLIVVDYERLASEPEAVMRRLYDELGEKWYGHDFARVEYDEPDYDAHIGMPGLHKVRGKVSLEKRESTIPPDLIMKHANCVSAWNKDPVSGVIGVQTGPH